jgi:acyl CoA:acetate/3-ketoacid CoA transferase beta subunit
MDRSPAACTVVSRASTDDDVNVMLPLPSNPATFLAISFLSFSETGFFGVED